MIYLTREEFFQRSIASGSFSSLPLATVDAAISGSSDYIDMALGPYHPSGVVGPTPALQHMASVVASYNLMLHNGFSPTGDDGVIERQFNMVIGPGGMLDQIRRGLMQLPKSADSTPTTHEGTPKVYAASSSKSRGVRTFTDDGDEYI